MTLEEQGEAGRAFLTGLLSEFGMEGTVECHLLDEDTVEIAATGEDLGILVGPRGSTLSAVQDLTRAVVQRQCPSRTDRILVDVAGYRERRSAALKRFSIQIAEEVLASGQEKALEAMSPADRKAVHDAVNEMPGVMTRSEGEDPTATSSSPCGLPALGAGRRGRGQLPHPAARSPRRGPRRRIPRPRCVAAADPPRRGIRRCGPPTWCWGVPRRPVWST